ncbi:hypothetical protein HJG60_011255 [Phyllostomus discolor]|uniref:Secreted protein n=1 Tax=Phyllostomus discolor TaxID=89673 RepID=A0A834A283_9CHIR|nr:hypothetical protein HJG60_011255 [Phyllostomus discolor]
MSSLMLFVSCPSSSPLFLFLLFLHLHNVLDFKCPCTHLLLWDPLFLNSEGFSFFLPEAHPDSPSGYGLSFPRALAGLSLMAIFHCTVFKSHLWRFLFLHVGLGSSGEGTMFSGPYVPLSTFLVPKKPP